MAANLDVGKIFSTVERMVCCKISIEINITPLKEPAFWKCTYHFWNITQTMGDFKVSCQNKYSVLQRMDDCHSFCDTIRYTESFKGFEMKPLWVFSYSPRDKNFRGFPYK